MGFDQYHEPPEELPAETRTFARLCASLEEESQAIGWYQQRLAVEPDAEGSRLPSAVTSARIAAGSAPTAVSSGAVMPSPWASSAPTCSASSATSTACAARQPTRWWAC